MAQKFGNGRWVHEGFLDNRIEGSVVGRIVFAAIGAVDFYLTGNFKADIAGQVIQFRNQSFEDDETAAYVIGDLENPQIGAVNLISFDPHPNLVPHPYVEWFSGRTKNHYRFELKPEEAWIISSTECAAINEESRFIRASLAGQATDRREQTDSDWV